jgi:hemolysin activation/secretion protein
MKKLYSIKSVSLTKKLSFLCFALVIMIYFPIEVFAQTVNIPSVTNDPTKAEQPLLLPSALPEKTDKGFALPDATKIIGTPKSGATIEINQVEFPGNTVFKKSELEALAQSFLNHPIRTSDIEDLRLKVSQYYIDHGYINSGALFDENQSLADGILHLKIIEGRLKEVRQTGQERLRDEYIAQRLIVGSGEPLSVNALQDSYRRLLADPLIEQLNGRLLPGAHPGEAVLDLQVKRKRPYQLNAGTDDYSTPAVGGYTGRIGGWVDNLLTMGEHIDGQVIVNGGGIGYNTSINMPINAYDTRILFRFSDTYSTLVEAPFNTLNISTRVIGFDGGISHPVYRSLADDLTLGLNFVVRQSRTLQSNDCIAGANFTGINGDTNCNSQVSVLRMSQHASHRGETVDLHSKLTHLLH